MIVCPLLRVPGLSVLRVGRGCRGDRNESEKRDRSHSHADHGHALMGRLASPISVHMVGLVMIDRVGRVGVREGGGGGGGGGGTLS